MKINKAEFVKSSTTLEQCPETEFPEFAFVWRSNVGKSSLINMLTQRSQLARSSNTPGKTQEINHFLINDDRSLVDLPGYGYAKSSRTNREKRVDSMYEYLMRREQLLMVFVLIDSKIPPQKIDIDFICDLHDENVPFSIIYTKTDKAKQKQLHENKKNFEKEIKQLDIQLPSTFQTSSIKWRGREQILNYINMILSDKKAH